MVLLLLTLGTCDNVFDFDNAGTTDALDFGQFIMRFGTGI